MSHSLVRSPKSIRREARLAREAEQAPAREALRSQIERNAREASERRIQDAIEADASRKRLEDARQDAENAELSFHALRARLWFGGSHES